MNDFKPLSTFILIAIFERVIRLYASPVNMIASRQFGLDAMIKAAPVGIELQVRLVNCLDIGLGIQFAASRIASAIGGEAEVEHISRIHERLGGF